MLVRLGLNTAAHLAAGIGVGLLAVAAMSACKRRQRDETTHAPADGETPAAEAQSTS